MELSITQAAQTFKVSRQTISKKINQGVLSKKNNGKIDVAEMVRVFGEPTSRDKKKLTLSTSTLQAESLRLHEQIRHLEAMERVQRERAERAEKQAELLFTQNMQLNERVLLLEAPEQMKKKRGFFGRIF